LSAEQQDVLFGRKLPEDWVDTDTSKQLRAKVADIDASESALDLAQASSQLIQSALRAQADGKALSKRENQLVARTLRKAKQLGVSGKDLVRAAFMYRSKIEGNDVFELAGVTPEQLSRFLGEQSPANETPQKLQSVGPESAEAPSVEGDRARYDQIQAEWADLRKQGVPPDDPRITKLWRENEEIKNRHGGMPPGEVSGEVESPPSQLDTMREARLLGVKATPLDMATPDGQEAVRERVAKAKAKQVTVPVAESAPEQLPPAQMKRPELRAELAAAGVQSVSGTPLDEANAAQLMNAVGKLRRGQLDDSPTKTSDKLLSKLDAAIADQKKKMEGKVYSAPEGLYDAGKLAALEVARLAVRAGRPVEQAVRLAIARFKAKHPQHSPDDLTKLETEVRTALTEDDGMGAEGRGSGPSGGSGVAPEGQRKPSKFPESLKARNAPVESIDYDVRNQDARKQEAAAFVQKEGRAKAEQALDDPSIPGDTRVAIGGNLLAERQLALADAKPEEVDSIVRDIRRITAKMRPSLATEAGQQIAMFNAIYQDVGVASMMEYERAATKKQTDQLGGTDATNAINDATDAANKAETQADIESEIEKLKAKYTTKPVRKVLDSFKKKLERVMELKRLGALTREDMTEIAAKELGLAGPDPKKLKHIAEIAEKIKKAKSHSERSRAELELAEALQIYKGVGKMDVASSILTANILSGYTTQQANLLGNTLNSIAQLATTAATNPTNLPALLKGFLHGLPEGGRQAAAILKTGVGTRDFQDKTGGAGSILNTVDFARDFGVPEPVGKVATVAMARLPEKVFRFMKAADAVFYYPAREAYQRLVATKLLEGKYQGAELSSRVNELLHTTPQAFLRAKQQAESEGYEGVEVGRRISDIIEGQRAETTEGAQAVKEGERFAAETTFQNEPEGLAGVAYHALKYAVEEGRLAGIPVLKPWAMFLKTPANVFNTITNYTPMGVARAKVGMRGAGFRNPERRHFTADEQVRLYVQSIIGTALMGVLVARAMQDDDMNITAKGPEDVGKKKQLQQAGWSPYSVRVGDRWVSYKDSPLLIPLAIAGHVADSVKYKKSKSDLVLENKVLDALTRAPQVIFDTSMLTGLADLMEAASGGKGGTKGLGRTLGSIPANLVIPYNRLLQQIDQTFDNQTYKAPPVVGSIPGVRRTGTPQTDVLGRPQVYNPTSRFTSQESSDPVDKVLRDKNVFIPEVGKDTRLARKITTPAEVKKRVDLGAPAPKPGERPIMSDAEREQFRKLSGQRIRVRLQSIAPRLRIMNQEQAQKEIDRIAEQERDRARPLIGLSPVR